MYVTAANPVGEISSGATFVHYEYSVGSITTVEGYKGPKVEGQIVNAADWLYIDPSQEHASVNLKGIVKTVTNASLHFSWTGHAYLDDTTAAILQHSAAPDKTPFGRLTVNNSFTAGDPALKGLNTTCFVGHGRYSLKNGQICVETRLARVVPPLFDE
jgi:hypothetical protein